MASSFLLQEAVSAYYSMYEQNVQEDLLWEALLTEEFVLEAYQTVADYLVHNNFVPGFQTAEVYMSEMALEDIDDILFETGMLNEQYLIEAGFFQGLGAGADRLVNRASNAVRGAAQTVKGTAQRAGQAVAGGVQRAGQAVAGAGRAVVGGAQRAGQTLAGAAQRAGQAVSRAVTPVAQAVKGTAQRAVSAGTSALQGAGRAVAGAGQAALGTAQRAGQAVAGGAQAAGRAVAGAAGAIGAGAQAAGRRIGQEIEISRRVGAGEPVGGVAKPAPTAPKPQSGTTTPKGSSVPSTGVSGLSAADRAAYSAGGGNAAAQRGMGQTTAQVISQGKTNLGRMNQGAPAPAGAKPTSGGSSTNPKSGLSAYPASRTAAPARSAAPAPAAPARSAAAPTSTPAAAPPATSTPTSTAPARQSLASQAAELRGMRQASQQRQASMLKQSFDLFDVVLGHLLDEGYAENEEQALTIMANMSEEWRDEIVEAAYSAKAARAGKDIGKPGKQFAKIAASAAERYGSEESGKKVAGAVLAKLRAKKG